MKTKTMAVSSSLFLNGFIAIAGQVILIRELLITFAGNELTIGIFFGNLLMLEAMGSYAASHRIERTTGITLKFILLQNLVSISLVLAIISIRTIRTIFGILPGESIPVLLVFIFSLVLLLPFGFLNGALFTHACRLLAEKREVNNLIAGRVYVLEALGSIAGGIAVTYLALNYLNSLQTAHLLIILALLAGLLLLSQSDASGGKNSKRTHMVTVLVIFTGSILLFNPLTVYLQKKTIQWQYREYDPIRYENSIYGNVSLLRQMDQYILLSNGIPVALFPTPDIAFNEDFAHLPFLFCESAQNVLLIGGGNQGIIGEILKHPVLKIDYTELDPLLLETVREYVPDKDRQDLSDPRIHIHYTDGRFFLRQKKEKYDLILLNLPEPASLEINRFYTVEFFRLCRENLTEKGLIVFQLPGSSTYMNHELLNLNACILKTAGQIFSNVKVLPDESSLYLATSDTTLFTRTIEESMDRFARQKIQARMMTPAYIKYKLSARVQESFEGQLSVLPDIRINRDLIPAALSYCLAYQNSMHSPRFSVLFGTIQGIHPGFLFVFILMIMTFFFWQQRFRSQYKKAFIIIPVVCSGFIGMGIPVVLYLLFQSLFGYVYFWIGLLVTSFMTGLAGGSWWINRRLKKIVLESRWFAWLLVLLAGYLVLLIAGLMSLNVWEAHISIRPGMEFIFLIACALCGLLVGILFPLANRMYLSGEASASKTGGILYAADLAGAWSGGLIVTVWIIPAQGIIYSVLVFLVVNILALIFFILARK